MPQNTLNEKNFIQFSVLQMKSGEWIESVVKSPRSPSSHDIAEIAVIARHRRDLKSKSFNHKGHEGTQRKPSEPYANLG